MCSMYELIGTAAQKMSMQWPTGSAQLRTPVMLQRVASLVCVRACATSAWRARESERGRDAERHYRCCSAAPPVMLLFPAHGLTCVAWLGHPGFGLVYRSSNTYVLDTHIVMLHNSSTAAQRERCIEYSTHWAGINQVINCPRADHAKALPKRTITISLLVRYSPVGTVLPVTVRWPHTVGP